MDQKKFTQKEVNQIVASRLKRDREKLIKDFDVKLKRCMTSIHHMMRQEMCAMKREAETEINSADESVEGGP